MGNSPIIGHRKINSIVLGVPQTTKSHSLWYCGPISKWRTYKAVISCTRDTPTPRSVVLTSKGTHVWKCRDSDGSRFQLNQVAPVLVSSKCEISCPQCVARKWKHFSSASNWQRSVRITATVRLQFALGTDGLFNHMRKEANKPTTAKSQCFARECFSLYAHTLKLNQIYAIFLTSVFYFGILFLRIYACVCVHTATERKRIREKASVCATVAKNKKI